MSEDNNKYIHTVDMREPSYNKTRAEIMINIQKCYKINQLVPFSIDLYNAFNNLLGGNFDISNYILPPVSIDLPSNLKLGKCIYINSGLICQAQGGIIIEDNVIIGPRVTLISVNHDLKDKNILHCKPVLIKENAWIGAGAIINAGVTIGKNSVVASGAVVTKNVEDNTVVGGVPAEFIKNIE